VVPDLRSKRLNKKWSADRADGAIGVDRSWFARHRTRDSERRWSRLQLSEQLQRCPDRRAYPSNGVGTRPGTAGLQPWLQASFLAQSKDTAKEAVPWGFPRQEKRYVASEGSGVSVSRGHRKLPTKWTPHAGRGPKPPGRDKNSKLHAFVEFTATTANDRFRTRSHCSETENSIVGRELCERSIPVDRWSPE